MAPGATLLVCEVLSESEYWAAQQNCLAEGVDVITSSYSYKWAAVPKPDYHMHRQVAQVELAAGVILANSIGNQGGLLPTYPIPFNIATPGNCPAPFAHPALADGGRGSVMGCGGIELPDLTSLGFPAPLFERYRATLARNQGLIFLTGPTGSGKTTTIYASLGHIKKTRGGTTQIATIEDPVEFDVPFLTQTQVNNEVGMTFAQGLRSILRQDPNVMMVGEIRDAETARIAVQAGLTGHLILTTVHADSSAGVFNRLIESGVEPFVLASASLASVSQRLVRALCPRCRAPAPASPDEEARLLQSGLPAGGLFYVAVGCKKCGGAGYLGRTAIYELLTVSMAIRDLINAKVPTPHIQQRAVFEGMVPLLTAGVERARSGATTLAEVLRVCA